MAAVDGAGPLTRSRIEAFDQTAAVLSNSATQWRVQAQRLQHVADIYVDQVNTPNGTEWTGQTAVSYFETAHADRLAVSPAFTHANAMADIGERGGEQLMGAREAALAYHRWPRKSPNTSARWKGYRRHTSICGSPTSQPHPDGPLPPLTAPP